jgi:hypothetical protein
VTPVRQDYIDYRIAAPAGAIPADGNNNPTRGISDEAMLFRASKVESNRTEHADGRYYELPADLVVPQPINSINRLVTSAVLSELLFRETNPPYSAIHEPLGAAANLVIEDWRFDENFNRFRRLANTITTRSDVFEVLVTVQSGFGVDANGDGRINWRDDNEFRATATKSARTVYER